MVLKKKEHNYTPFFCYLSNLKYGTSITICNGVYLFLNTFFYTLKQKKQLLQKKYFITM